MSRIKIQPPTPVIHTPTFKKWGVPRSYVVEVVRSLGLELLYPGTHAKYNYTNSEGVEKLLPDLILKSSLYKKDIFTCINYSFKVWNEASLRYDLNTWIPVIGRLPDIAVRHAWNLLLIGDGTGLKPDQFLYFEPNNGYSFSDELELAGQAFPIGEEQYTGELAFL